MTERTAADKTAAPPLFTLVMCVYGVERYIADAVRSALDQPFEDFEVLLVDDGTPDASVARALEAADGDPRVRLVRHDVNRGLSAARNTGLANARGTYVSFPDPDDVLGPEYLSAAAAAIAETGADIVVEGTRERYFDAEGAHVYDNAIVPDKTAASDPGAVASLALELEVSTLLGYVNNKFFRRETVEGLAFDESITVSEDFFFTLEAFSRARSVAVVPVAAYEYAKRATSLTGGRYNAQRYNPEYYRIHRRRIEAMLRYLEANGEDTEAARSTLGALYGRYIVSTLMRQAAPEGGLSLKERGAWVRSLHGDELFQELVPGARARDSRALAVSLAVLRSKVVPAALLLGSAVSRAKAAGPGIVTKIQSRR